MSDDTRNQVLAAATRLAGEGKVDAAVSALLSVSAIDEAATLLVGVRRFADAARIIMEALAPVLDARRPPDARQRQLLQKAAVCFANNGDADVAVELYLGIGEPHRAMQVLERAGDAVGAARLEADLGQGRRVAAASLAGIAARAVTMAAAQRLEQEGKLRPALAAFMQLRRHADAARVARKLGDLSQAAHLYLGGAMPFEAAGCYFEAGDSGKCLDALVHVPREDPRYRDACVQAVRIASELGVLDFALDQFLAPFARSNPRGDAEFAAFSALGRMYEAHDFGDSARRLYEKLCAVFPSASEPRERLAALSERARGGDMAFAKIVREDASFMGDELRRPRRVPTSGGDALPELPDLPELPPLGLSSVARSPLAATLPQVEAPARSPAPPPAAIHAAASDESAQVAVGELIAGRYRVDRVLGQGGMAVVYLASDVELGEPIAIKLFNSVVTDEGLIARFKQELSLSRRLAHPNIVRMYDIGTHRGRKFITMELLRGHALADYMGAPVDLVSGLWYLVQACEGLAAAHAQGIIHRDIKPDNFFVTDDGVLKVVDFGIAKAGASEGLTQAGFMAGTPGYMSPEQINNFTAVTHLSDIYALGIVAFEMFTGAVPFGGDDLMPILMAHLNEVPPTPTSRGAKISAELEAVILRLLEKDPARRIQSCAELGAIFRRIAGLVRA